MKTNEAQTIAPAKPYILSALTLVFFFYIMPFCSLPVRSVGGAILFTVFFCFYPDSLRSRGHSLTPAFCLTAFVWLCVAGTVMFSFFGAH
jgi:hypothetical protein